MPEKRKNAIDLIIGRNFIKTQVLLALNYQWGEDKGGSWYIQDLSRLVKYTRRDRDKIEFLLPESEENDLWTKAASAQKVLSPNHSDEDILETARMIEKKISPTTARHLFLMDLMELSSMVLDELEQAVYNPDAYVEKATYIDRELAVYPLRREPPRGYETVIKIYFQNFLLSRPYKEDWLKIHNLQKEDVECFYAEGVEIAGLKDTAIAMDHQDGKITRPNTIGSLFRDIGFYLFDRKFAFVTYFPKSLGSIGRKIFTSVLEKYGKKVVGFTDSKKDNIGLLKKLGGLVESGYIVASAPEQCDSGVNLAVGREDFIGICKVSGVDSVTAVSTSEVKLGIGKFKYRYIVHKPLPVKDLFRDPKTRRNAGKLVHLVMWLVASSYDKHKAGIYGRDDLVNQKISGLFPDLNYEEKIVLDGKTLVMTIKNGVCKKMITGEGV